LFLLEIIRKDCIKETKVFFGILGLTRTNIAQMYFGSQGKIKAYVVLENYLENDLISFFVHPTRTNIDPTYFHSE